MSTKSQPALVSHLPKLLQSSRAKRLLRNLQCKANYGIFLFIFLSLSKACSLQCGRLIVLVLIITNRLARTNGNK